MTFWILFQIYYLAIVYLFIFSEREENISLRKRLTKYIPYLIIASLLLWFVGAYLVGRINTFFISLYVFFASNLLLTFSLILIRKIIVQSNWFIIMFIPIAYFFILSLASINTPEYNGALAGMSWPVAYFANFYVFFLYPIYVFSLTMLRLNRKIKGIILLVVSVVSGSYGILLSYGKEGFLANSYATITFVFVIFILTTWGLFHFTPLLFCIRRNP